MRGGGSRAVPRAEGRGGEGTSPGPVTAKRRSVVSRPAGPAREDQTNTVPLGTKNTGWRGGKGEE